MSISVATDGRVSYSIFIVDEDQTCFRLFSSSLENAGCGLRVHAVQSSIGAFQEIKEYSPDLIIMDTNLTGTSGVDLLLKLSADPVTKDIPKIVASEESNLDNRIRALECGADDYLSKPVTPTELVARVRTILRRCKRFFGSQKITVGDVSMNLTTRSVEVCGRSIKVSVREFGILRLLMECPNKVFSRQDILKAVWPSNAGLDNSQDSGVFERTVDVHINRLRIALGRGKHNRSYIRTVRGSGYSLDVSEYSDGGLGYLAYINSMNLLKGNTHRPYQSGHFGSVEAQEGELAVKKEILG